MRRRISRFPVRPWPLLRQIFRCSCRSLQWFLTDLLWPPRQYEGKSKPNSLLPRICPATSKGIQVKGKDRFPRPPEGGKWRALSELAKSQFPSSNPLNPGSVRSLQKHSCSSVSPGSQIDGPAFCRLQGCSRTLPWVAALGKNKRARTCRTLRRGTAKRPFREYAKPRRMARARVGL